MTKEHIFQATLEDIARLSPGADAQAVCDAFEEAIGLARGALTTASQLPSIGETASETAERHARERQAADHTPAAEPAPMSEPRPTPAPLKAIRLALEQYKAALDAGAVEPNWGSTIAAREALEALAALAPPPPAARPASESVEEWKCCQCGKESADGDWYRVCGPCRWHESEPAALPVAPPLPEMPTIQVGDVVLDSWGNILQPMYPWNVAIEDVRGEPVLKFYRLPLAKVTAIYRDPLWCRP